MKSKFSKIDVMVLICFILMKAAIDKGELDED